MNNNIMKSEENFVKNFFIDICYSLFAVFKTSFCYSIAHNASAYSIEA